MNVTADRFLPSFPASLAVAALCGLIASCGSGGGDGGGAAVVVEQEMIEGRVIDGYVSSARVCLDVNGNARCDANESQTLSDTAGAYRLSIPKGSTAPLLAEVVAGQSQDSDQPGVAVDVGYRMLSPARTYSTDITPFSTLVHLTGERDFPLAEDLVRNVVGLPPKYAIKLTAAPDAGSLTQSVAKAVVQALKATSSTLDLSAPGALNALAAAFPSTLTTLPQLVITTKDAAPIVSREDYVDATFVLTNPAAAAPTANLNGRIRGRGHSTWGQPKNPYKIQFTNDAAYGKVPDFLGMKKNRNWALLADYFDRSLIRNKLALSLGSSSVFSDGLKWNPSGQHVEVWLNGDYVGVYLMTEDIRIASSRLNIKEMSSDPAVGDVDGGYIVEVDVRLDCYNVGELNLQLVTPQGISICQDTPDEGAITAKQLAYIKALLLQIELDLYGSNRLDRINPASFADWYLIQELFRNNDAAFVSSDYMWKDTDSATNPLDRLVNMGPLWDFDRAAGNVNYLDNWKSEGCWVNKSEVPNWFSRLAANPDFVALTISRWKAKRTALSTFVNSSIDTYERRLALAQQRNFARWPIFDVPLTNYYVFANHAEEVAFVKRFLNERMLWLDKAFASPEAYAALCK